MTIVCDLYSQWISLIRENLTRNGLDCSSISDDHCAITWRSWQRRSVLPANRTVFSASNFLCPPKIIGGLEKLRDNIRSGNDIWPWQSKLIETPTSKEDGMLNHWGIFHFHLGDNFEANGSGYIERTKELLFAVVEQDAFYEIGVYQHRDWYEYDVLNIIDTEWPMLLDRVTINADSLSCNFAEDRDSLITLRKKNVNILVKLRSGRIIAPPGGGVAANGASIEAVNWVLHWTRFLENGSQLIIDDIDSQISQGNMPLKDYAVVLEAGNNKVAAKVNDPEIGEIVWILWKKGN